MNRSKTFRLIVLCLLIALISACNDGNNSQNLSQEDSSTDASVVLLEEEESKSTDNDVEIEGAQKTLKIYISADRTGTRESGIAIERGIQTALSQVNHMVKDYKLEVVTLDHRGSTPRAEEHLQAYLEDDQALVVFSGLHSPPLLATREFINEQGILLLDPWAAAGPITRYPSAENWIFRLSVDDTKAGYFISDYAVNEGFKKPYLLLEETGWGTSNEKTMTAGLESHDIAPAKIGWFNWNLGINQAKVLLREAKQSGADVIFFVGNAPEGKVFAQAMSELAPEEQLPIRSHWGITGGDFPTVINKTIRSHIDLKFLQTSFSFIGVEEGTFGYEVLQQAMALYPEDIKQAEDISAPTGFVHSYDLTLLLLEALDQVTLTEDIKENRRLIRMALENLSNPVEGLIKIYKDPFDVYSDDNIDAHEALGKADLKMAMYGEENQINLLD